MRPLIVIPTFNESENIENLITRLLRCRKDVEILVVDDNSPDGTANIVRKIKKNSAKVHLHVRDRKQGIGPAYIAGFKWALSHGFDVMIEMDADLSHRPRYVSAFIDKIQKYDLVIGSRWIRGGCVSNWSLGRLLLSRAANVYSRLVLGIPVNDLTGGFTCWRRGVLEKINLDEIRSDGYCFQIEMKYRAIKQKFRWTEIPIRFRDRQSGRSKISRKIVFEALLLVWWLRMSRSIHTRTDTSTSVLSSR
jgi:dolichol-phosphate mannosyltransferase